MSPDVTCSAECIRHQRLRGLLLLGGPLLLWLSKCDERCGAVGSGMERGHVSSMSSIERTGEPAGAASTGRPLWIGCACLNVKMALGACKEGSCSKEAKKRITKARPRQEVLQHWLRSARQSMQRQRPLKGRCEAVRRCSAFALLAWTEAMRLHDVNDVVR